MIATFKRSELAIRGYDPARHFPPRWKGTLIDILNNEACPVDTRLALVLALLPEKRRITAAMYLVRNTPLGDGRTVADLITDERLIDAMHVYERYVAGDVTFWDVLITERDAFQVAVKLDQIGIPSCLHRAALAAAWVGTSCFLAVKTAATVTQDATRYNPPPPMAAYETQIVLLCDLLTKEIA